MDFFKFADNMVKEASKVIDDASKTTSSVLNEAGKALDSAGKVTGDLLSDSVKVIGDVSNKIGDVVSDVSGQAATVANDTVQQVTEVTTGTINQAGKIATEAKSQIDSIDIFNGKLRSEAIENYHESIQTYNEKVTDLTNKSTELYKTRDKAIKVVKIVEERISKLANKVKYKKNCSITRTVFLLMFIYSILTTINSLLRLAWCSSSVQGTPFLQPFTNCVSPYPLAVSLFLAIP